MERLLAKKGIELVSYINEDGAKVSYAFTEEMLKQQIVVVLTEASGDWYYDSEEEAYEEEEEWEETEEAEEEADEEAEAHDEEDGEEIEMEGWDDESAAETTIAVVFTKDNIAYDFTICVDDRPVIPLIYLYGIIKELVDIITASDTANFIDDLGDIATGMGASNEFEEDPEFCDYLYNLGVEHLAKAASLLQEKKS